MMKMSDAPRTFIRCAGQHGHSQAQLSKKRLRESASVPDDPVPPGFESGTAHAIVAGSTGHTGLSVTPQRRLCALLAMLASENGVGHPTDQGMSADTTTAETVTTSVVSIVTNRVPRRQR